MVSVHSLVLSPDEITQLAGVGPTGSHCLGDCLGVVHKKTAEANHWSLVIKVRGEDEKTDSIHWFSDGIVRLLTPIRTDFVQRLKEFDPDVGAIIWVGLFDIQDQGAFNIRSDASKMLGERDLELVFDMYVDHSAED